MSAQVRFMYDDLKAAIAAGHRGVALRIARQLEISDDDLAEMRLEARREKGKK